MAHDDPIIEPRVVERLRKRERLVDYGVREELLEQTGQVLHDRRKPATLAEKLSRKGLQELRNIGQPVVEDRAEERLNSVFNE